MTASQKSKAAASHLPVMTDQDDVYHVDTFESLCAVVAKWTQDTFGAPALAVLVGRANREMADLIDDAAIGKTDDLPRRAGNILVVLAAIAAREGFTLTQALSEAHADNAASDWDIDAWYRGTKRRIGPVPDDEATRQMIAAVQAGVWKPEQFVVILRARGVSFNDAYEFVFQNCPEHPMRGGAFDPDKDLTPAARRQTHSPLSRFTVTARTTREGVIYGRGAVPLSGANLQGKYYDR